MRTRFQQWLNSPWWDQLDGLSKFGYLTASGTFIAGLVAAVILELTS